jgi:dihydroxy-acid dehydratase
MKSLEHGEINEQHFIIIRYQGEIVGCPEMLKPTSALAGYFGIGNTPPLATDGRFSGGSHGILVCHLPDAYKHDNLTSIIMDGDKIIMDLSDNKLSLDISVNEIATRKVAYNKKKPKLSGSLRKFSNSVGEIDTGYLCN